MFIQKCIYSMSVVLILLMATGCGASRQVKPEIKKTINTVEVRLVFKRPDIYAYSSRHSLNPLSGTVGLIVDVAQDVSRNEDEKRKADAMWTVVKALQPYKVPDKAKNIYQASFKKVSWMKATSWTIDKNDYPEYFKTTRASTHDAVLFIEIDYYLADNLKRLSVNTKTNLYRNLGANADPQKVFHMMDDQIYDLSKHANGLYDKHELGKKWSENNAAVLKAYISKGLKKQADYLVKKLDPPIEPEQSFAERFWGKKVKTD